MLVPEIQKPFADLKETEKGQREMTEALAQLEDKGKLEVIETVVRNMTDEGFQFDQIVRLTGASADEIQKIVDHISMDNPMTLS